MIFHIINFIIMARLTKKDKLNEMINNYCESHQIENFNYLNVALISYKLTMWNCRVPPGLPAVLQLRGYVYLFLFIYLGFYVAFNTVQVISRRVVGRAEETSTYSSLGFCTVNCRPTASNYQLSHLRP